MSDEDVRTLYNRISIGGHLPRRVEWMGVSYTNPDETWEVDEDYEGGHPASPPRDDEGNEPWPLMTAGSRRRGSRRSWSSGASEA